MLAIVLLACSTLCSQASTPAKVHKDETFTEFFRRTNGLTAGDGAISVPLTDGRVLWLFGDSHLDDLEQRTGTMPCLFQTRNAGLLQSSKEAKDALTLVGAKPGFRSWFKNSTNNNEWFWPGCGFQSGEKLYIYLFALRKTKEGGMWGWEATGQDYWGRIELLTVNPAQGSSEGLGPATYIPLPALNGIGFGNGFVKEDDFVYAYGGKQRELASDLYVARFKSAAPATAWTFWDGTNWTSNATHAAAIGRGASTSLHVCKVKGNFLMTTSAFSMRCDQGKDIYMATSLGPTGPFSAQKKIYTIEDRYQGHVPFFYFPIAHPEFINDRNELLVTYSINGYEPCVSACIKGRAIPDHYRPKAFRVPLEGLANPGLNENNP
jgi:hypothetical protein